MYKVFFKESYFLLTDDTEALANNRDHLIYDHPENLRSFIFSHLYTNNIFHAIIYSPDIKQLFPVFQSAFKMVIAGGGAVIHAHNLLVMKRSGFYDLPKGHLECNESIETCAMREVTEECGVKNLKILHPLHDTWHIYYRDSVWHLKRTYWFLMQCPFSQQLIPQTEEDIEAVFWYPIAQTDTLLASTYASLREIFCQVQQLYADAQLPQ